MFDALITHFRSEGLFAVLAIIVVIALAFAGWQYYKNKKEMGSLILVPKLAKYALGFGVIGLAVLLIYAMNSDVQTKTSDEIAVVLGNTQNSPEPKLDGEIGDKISATLRQQNPKEDVKTLEENIVFVSAIKSPKKIDLGDLKLKSISANPTDAARATRENMAMISNKLSNLAPQDNGANYLEAIFDAANNVDKKAPIVVIGSGLSDSGAANFAKDNILTNTQTREKTVQKIITKYGDDYLLGRNVAFYGLGDTNPPQENLSQKQKDVVREFYKDVVEGLGGHATITTKTQTGESVATNYTVSTTDTGCGDVNFTLDNNQVQFNGDAATFADADLAKSNLQQVADVYSRNPDSVKSIEVDGYIAHFPGNDNLSQARADAVKQTLIELGVDGAKVNAVGKGFGPFDAPLTDDAQQPNRMVKIKITRDTSNCEG